MPQLRRTAPHASCTWHCALLRCCHPASCLVRHGANPACAFPGITHGGATWQYCCPLSWTRNVEYGATAQQCGTGIVTDRSSQACEADCPDGATTWGNPLQSCADAGGSLWHNGVQIDFPVLFTPTAQGECVGAQQDPANGGCNDQCSPLPYYHRDYGGCISQVFVTAANSGIAKWQCRAPGCSKCMCAMCDAHATLHHTLATPRRVPRRSTLPQTAPTHHAPPRKP